MLDLLLKEESCSIYAINDGKDSAINRLVVSTPETRAISNDPLVMGVDYTHKLKKACSDVIKGLQGAKTISLEEQETIVFNILRGGLNFCLREAISDALGFNRHGSSFISAQRARDSKNSEDWHIIESAYKKVYMPAQASIVVGDVVATGTSLQHALEALIDEAVGQEAKLKSILFFTFGGSKAEEILEKMDAMCREKFPDYQGTTLCYLEGRFLVPNPETSLSIKITGTDLLRGGALMAPEFVESQYENPSYPLERCAIYDAGSRAFWIPEYLEDVIEYWEETLGLAQKGVSFKELLQERFPELEVERFGKVSLEDLCMAHLKQLRG